MDELSWMKTLIAQQTPVENVYRFLIYFVINQTDTMLSYK